MGYGAVVVVALGTWTMQRAVVFDSKERTNRSASRPVCTQHRTGDAGHLHHVEGRPDVSLHLGPLRHVCAHG